MLQLILWKLERYQHWEKELITGCITQVAEHLGFKLRDVMPLMFAAITGQASSTKSCSMPWKWFGPDLTRFRLRNALELLGGASKKKTEWEKLLATIG
ncbi:Glutamate--tRNA ligase OS=Stutzerimonas stutzeri OX=316 GN=gltX PE=3 SV=1 [Stutzerimonas stutzeri]